MTTNQHYQHYNYSEPHIYSPNNSTTQNIEIYKLMKNKNINNNQFNQEQCYNNYTTYENIGIQNYLIQEYLAIPNNNNLNLIKDNNNLYSDNNNQYNDNKNNIINNETNNEKANNIDNTDKKDKKEKEDIVEDPAEMLFKDENKKKQDNNEEEESLSSDSDKNSFNTL